MIRDIQIPPEDLDNKFILTNITDEINTFEFVRINYKSESNLLIIAQKFMLLRDETEFPCVKIIYRSDRDLFSPSLYAITKLLYHSIMYFRHLPLKKKYLCNRLSDENRFLLEINNVDIILLMLNNIKSAKEYLSRLKFDSDDADRISLVELGKEYADDGWELNEQRIKLIYQIESQLSKIKNLYQNKKYKEIRKIGYDIHNIPEMIRTMIVF